MSQKILLLFLMWFVAKTTARDDITHLSITSTACSECVSNDEPCLSSILVNGTEYSGKTSGLNTVSINLKSGVVKTGNFKFQDIYDSSDVVTNEHALNDMLKFVREASNSTLLVFATHGMCYIGNDDWYLQLEDMDDVQVQRDTNSYWFDVAIVVACKGECPIAVNGTLPFSTFRQIIEWETKEISFLWNGNMTTTTNPTTKNSNNQLYFTISISIGVTMAVCFVLILVFIHRRRRDKSTAVDQAESTTFSEDDFCHDSKLNSHHEISNQVYQHKIELLQVPRGPTENIQGYSSTEDIHRNIELDRQQYTQRPCSAHEYMSIKSSQTDQKAIKQAYRPSSSENISTILESCKILSPSPGSSHQLFKKSLEGLNRTDTIQTGNFATYVHLKSNAKDTETYKIPTNIPKFQSPVILPKNLPRNSYLNMADNDYANLYQSLTQSHSVDDVYQSLKIK